MVNIPKQLNKDEIGFLNFLNETDIALSSMFPEDDDKSEEEVLKTKEVNVERVNSNVIIVSKASTLENDNNIITSSMLQ